MISRDRANPQRPSAAPALTPRFRLGAALMVCAVFQNPTATSAQPRLEVRTISVAEGLSQSTGQVLFQDRLGIIWIGTQNGLNRYDGNEITIFRADPQNPDALQGTSVTDLTEDKNGTLWVGTESAGLSRMDRETGHFESFRHEAEDDGSISTNDISAIEVDQAGTLWVATSGGGLNRFETATETFTRFVSDPDDPGSLPSDWIIDLKAQADGHLLVATDGGGLSRLDPASGRFDKLWPAEGDTTSIPVVIEIALDPDGGIWLATPEGLIHMSAQDETVTSIPEIADELVFSVNAATDGSVWAGTADGGLWVTDRSGGPALRVDETLGFGDDTVYSLLEDDSGLMWVGTESAGVKLLSPAETRFRPLGQFMEERDTWSILERGNGEIWVGTAAGGIDVLDEAGEVTRTYRDPDDAPTPEGGIPWGIVLTMMEASDGGVWLGMDGEGIARWEPETDRFTRFEPDSRPGFRTMGAMDFVETADSNIWMATPGWGLVQYEPAADAFTEFSLSPDSSDVVNYALSLTEIGGLLWVGAEEGLVRFDPETGQADIIRPDPQRPDGLPANEILQVSADHAGGLWAATSVGLHHLRTLPEPGEEARFERINHASGLPDDMVYALQTDEEGTMWMSTNRGLAAMDPNTQDIRAFGMVDGLPGFEYNHGAYARGLDGTLLFGGIEGITRVGAGEAAFRGYAAPIVITAVEVFNEEVASDLTDGASLSMRHNQNYLTFTYASMDYRRPGANRFAYRLEPVDGDWTQAGDRRYQSYHNLAPGVYTFSVRGTNSEGVWNPDVTSITIDIVPPVWQRAWFRFLAGLMIVGTLTAAVRWRIRSGLRERDQRIMVQRRINDRLEEERVHLARELHDGPIQQLQLSGFQLQALNDHVDESGSPALAGVRAAVGDAMGELRAICGDLRPPALVHFGLSSAVRSHAERLLDTYEDLSLELFLPTEQRLLSARVRLGLFRMYQEAMSNVIRHARPCLATVRLTISEEFTELRVTDSGAGFVVPPDWSGLASQNHFGLMGASERATAVDGTMSVTSKPGHGTSISFRIPSAFQEEIE
jgi:ligand-binding sensor domain-containing protein/signal transduction histidine kinase